MSEQIVITRNGVALPFVQMEVLKGKRKGMKFLAPPVDYSTDDAWKNVLTWFGKETVAGFMQAEAKKACRDIYTDCLGDDGKLNDQKFVELAADPFAAAMTLAEIGAKIEEAQATMLGYVADLDNISDGVIPADLAKKMQETKSYILGLKEMFAKRKRTKADEPEEADGVEPSAAVR